MSLATAIDPHLLQEAADRLRQALAQHPNDVAAINELATIRRQQGFFQSAIAGFELAIRLRPDLAALRFNQGNTFQAAGRLDEAINAFQEALRIQPNFPEAWQNLGDTFSRSQRFNEAIQAYRSSLQWRPHSIEVRNNLAMTWIRSGQWNEAEGCLKQALELDPNHPYLWNNLGIAQRALGKWAAADRAFQTAVGLKPDYYEALANWGSLLILQQRPEEAEKVIEKAVLIRPQSGAALCDLAFLRQKSADWDRLAPLCRSIVDIVDRSDFEDSQAPDDLVSPQTFLSLAIGTTPAQQLKCARRWSRSICALPIDRAAPRTDHRIETHDRLRIGYVSADFHEHPVGYCLSELLQAHDRSRFEIFGYSLGAKPGSAMHEHLRACFDRFRVVSPEQSHSDAARLIAADRIDILIDLQGYTPGCRPEIFACRPAPIQAAYLGYPGTMGSDFIDYLIVDEYVVSGEQRSHYRENLVYLPGCFMPSDGRRAIVERLPTRRHMGLPENAFVFCAFSMPFKITQSMFACWLRLLRSVPDSVLWLRDWSPTATERLRRCAARSGVAAERLVFAPLVEAEVHLARHRRADLYLDTFPYNQHSTAGDALRVGLPVLTLSGESFASRVAGSYLNALGLRELITKTMEEYEATALALATCPERLTSLRARLEHRVATSDVFSGAAVAGKLERAFLEMWAAYRSNLRPSAIGGTEAS